MTTKSATVAPEGKRYKYYGQEYRMPVGEIAKLANVSVRYMKDVLKLQGMGYQGRINEGWTMKQCFTDAGMERKRRKAPSMADMEEFKAVIIYLRGQLHDGEDEIKRLRGMLLDLGVEP